MEIGVGCSERTTPDAKGEGGDDIMGESVQEDVEKLGFSFVADGVTFLGDAVFERVSEGFYVRVFGEEDVDEDLGEFCDIV